MEKRGWPFPHCQITGLVVNRYLVSQIMDLLMLYKHHVKRQNMAQMYA